MKASFTIEEIFNLTKIDRWFLVQIKEIVDFEEELAGAKAPTVFAARWRGNPETMNQNSHRTWLNKRGLAISKMSEAKRSLNRSAAVAGPLLLQQALQLLPHQLRQIFHRHRALRVRGIRRPTVSIPRSSACRRARDCGGGFLLLVKHLPRT